MTNRSNSKTDYELIEAFRKGDTAAFKELYSRHAAPVLAYLVSLVQDRHLAEDILQDLFIGFIRNIDTFSGNMNMRAYLTASARNRTYNEWRNITRENDALKRYAIFEKINRTPESPIPFFLESDDLCGYLNDSLQKLRIEEREVIMLHIHSGLTLEKTAEVLDVPVGTAASRYRRAIKKLRTEMNTNLRAHET